MRIADLAPEQRPRERLLAGRGEELGDAELLALLWGSGLKGRSALEMAHDLLARHGGLAGLLGLGLHDWAACAGLGPARACQLWASLELARRVRRGRDAPRLGSPQAVGAHLLPSSLGWTEERFGLLVLNARNEVLAERILSQGTATATLVSPREFFREALKFGAVRTVAFHNHPSGDPSPSAEDRLLTRRLRVSDSEVDGTIPEKVELDSQVDGTGNRESPRMGNHPSGRMSLGGLLPQLRLDNPQEGP